MPHRLRVDVETLSLMPARKRWSNNFRDAQGYIHTITHNYMPQSEWSAMPESSDPTWMAVELGLFVLAWQHRE